MLVVGRAAVSTDLFANHVTVVPEGIFDQKAKSDDVFALIEARVKEEATAVSRYAVSDGRQQAGASLNIHVDVFPFSIKASRASHADDY